MKGSTSPLRFLKVHETVQLVPCSFERRAELNLHCRWKCPRVFLEGGWSRHWLLSCGVSALHETSLTLKFQLHIVVNVYIAVIDLYQAAKPQSIWLKGLSFFQTRMLETMPKQSCIATGRLCVCEGQIAICHFVEYCKLVVWFCIHSGAQRSRRDSAGQGVKRSQTISNVHSVGSCWSYHVVPNAFFSRGPNL